MRVEVLAGAERRRRWSFEEKARIVDPARGARSFDQICSRHNTLARRGNIVFHLAGRGAEHGTTVFTQRFAEAFLHLRCIKDFLNCIGVRSTALGKDTKEDLVVLFPHREHQNSYIGGIMSASLEGRRTHVAFRIFTTFSMVNYSNIGCKLIYSISCKRLHLCKISIILDALLSQTNSHKPVRRRHAAVAVGHHGEGFQASRIPRLLISSLSLPRVSGTLTNARRERLSCVGRRTMIAHAFACDGSEYEARVRSDGDGRDAAWLADIWKDGRFTGLSIPLGVEFDKADDAMRSKRFAGCEGMIEIWSRQGLL